jgi:hypothetical protein
MTCGGGHLGFPIGIKNNNFVEDLPMIIPGQFGFNCPSGFREESFSKMTTTAGHSFYIGPIGSFYLTGERYRLLRASGHFRERMVVEFTTTCAICAYHY